MKRVAVIGSTGSVGENALKVIEARPDEYRVVGLAAGANWERLAEQLKVHGPSLASICSEGGAERTCAMIEGPVPEVLEGDAGMSRVAAMDEADIVVMAVAGAAGLAPTLAAIEAGKTVALANKECLVMAGELVMARAGEKGVNIIPVDSEHSGIFQAMAGGKKSQVRRIVLPASGGPFLDTPAAELGKVTPEQAVNHPRWSMGRKISVDSATLVNKALELIEARWIFDLPPGRIDVIVHPEAIVHGMVEFMDGSVIAQMSVPDMRFPILHALAWPERVDAGLERLDLASAGSLTFRELDTERFPAPDLARRSLEMGGAAPAVFAAADEVLVDAFLEGKLAFTDIVPSIEKVLDAHCPERADSVAAVLGADGWAREQARKIVG